MDRDIKKLQKKVILTRLALAAVIAAGVIAMLLYMEPHLTGTTPEQGEMYGGNFLYLLLGILFSGFGTAGFAFIGRWKNELIRVYKREVPHRRQVKFEVEEDSDSTTYYALIRDLEPDSSNGWRIQLFVTPSQIPDKLLNDFCNAQVYFHPESGRPLLIQTEYGIFWTMSGKGAVQKI